MFQEFGPDRGQLQSGDTHSALAIPVPDKDIPGLAHKVEAPGARRTPSVASPYLVCS